MRLRYGHLAPAGTVAVTCWCEHSLVAVTLDEVMAGETHSCGRARCSPELLARV